MSRIWGCVKWKSAVLCALLVLAVVDTGIAEAAWAGGDGLLAVRPVSGAGLLFVSPSGAHVRRVYGYGYALTSTPRFSPAGTAVIAGTFAGVEMMDTGGSCLSCQVGPGAAPEFMPNGTDVTFVRGGDLVEDSIDGLRQATIATGGISDAAWSATGELAIVRHGRIWIGVPGGLKLLGAGDSPSWSPNGRELAFANRGRVLVHSGRVTKQVAIGGAPAFAPDGRSIAYIGARHYVRIVTASGGRSRRVGTVRGVGVDWQPKSSSPPTCTPPEGSTVIAQTPQAVLTQQALPPDASEGNAADYAYMACDPAIGQERLLERFTGNNIDGASLVAGATIAGDHIALVIEYLDAHYFVQTYESAVFDVRTGASVGPAGGGQLYCPSQAFGVPYQCGNVQQIVVSGDGAYAVLTDLEAITAVSSTGLITTLDTAPFVPPGLTPHLTDLTLVGDALTWNHDGSPRTATLG